MPKYYKLTDANDQTYGGCQWGEGVTHLISGEGNLCGPGWTHWYTHPLLAVMLNPTQGNFDLTTAHLWESPADQVAEKTDHGLKVGCMKGTTVRRVPLPEVTLTQKIAFGILCSLEVCTEQSYVTWANNWLLDIDRSQRTAAWTVWTAGETVWAARAARAAWVAAGAAWVAAGAAGMAKVAVGATEVAEVAAGAARAAWMAAQNKPLSLIRLAKKAMKVKP